MITLLTAVNHVGPVKRPPQYDLSVGQGYCNYVKLIQTL